MSTASVIVAVLFMESPPKILANAKMLLNIEWHEIKKIKEEGEKNRKRKKRSIYKLEQK